MTISTNTIIDKTEVLQDGTIQVRQAEIILKDNVEISRSFTRWVRHPGDTEAQSDPFPISVISNVVWTAEVINTYKASVIANSLTNS